MEDVGGEEGEEIRLSKIVVPLAEEGGDVGLQKGSCRIPEDGSSPHMEECAEEVPALMEGLSNLSPGRPTPPLSPGLLATLSPGLPAPPLLKESLRARLPSRACVLPGLRACLV